MFTPTNQPLQSLVEQPGTNSEEALFQLPKLAPAHQAVRHSSRVLTCERGAPPPPPPPPAAPQTLMELPGTRDMLDLKTRLVALADWNKSLRK